MYGVYVHVCGCECVIYGACVHLCMYVRVQV